VLYRVTPVFREQELVARGVQIEAMSVEDNGEGICFHVYVYNAQPGVTIDYATGDSHATAQTPEGTAGSDETVTYYLNTNSQKFHTEDCSSAQGIREENKQIYTGTRQSLIDQGYTPAGCCDP